MLQNGKQMPSPKSPVPTTPVTRRLKQPTFLLLGPSAWSFGMGEIRGNKKTARRRTFLLS